jgi:deoxyribodipyrimidine photo-lyase
VLVHAAARDVDLAAHNGGWQSSAGTGTDAAPYFHIFNPMLQGRKFDPDGAFVRRWTPELARVPAPSIRSPWEMSEDGQAIADARVGVDDPTPIIDHAFTWQRVLAAYGEARRRVATHARRRYYRKLWTRMRKKVAYPSGV